MTGNAPGNPARRRGAAKPATAARPGGKAARATPAGPGGPCTGWRGATPEIIIALIMVVAVGAAGYVVAGPAAPGAVAIAAAAIILVILRGLLPPALAPAQPDEETAVSHPPASFTGFWRQRGGLTDGTRSIAAYDAGLRPTLQHLLAARLAERHGVSLRDDPEQARRLLCQGERDERLWYWVDPARPAGAADGQPGGRRGARLASQPRIPPGIPPRTLARLIDRLERL